MCHWHSSHGLISRILKIKSASFTDGIQKANSTAKTYQQQQI